MGYASMAGGAITAIGEIYTNQMKQEMAWDKARHDMTINNQTADVNMTSQLQGIESAKQQNAEDQIASDVALQIHSAKVKGAVKAEAGAVGMSGSIDMNIYDAEQQEEHAQMAMNMNSERFFNQIEHATLNAEKSWASETQTMPDGQEPDMMLSVLGGLDSGLSSFSSYQSLEYADADRKEAEIDSKAMREELAYQRKRSGRPDKAKATQQESSWFDWF